MNKKICAAIIFLLVLTLVGCNNNNTVPQAGPNVNNNKIMSLQQVIDNANVGAVLDFSEYNKITESGNLTINKSLTLRGLNADKANIIVSNQGVTLTGIAVNNVTTCYGGSNGLKIANSVLASMNFGVSTTARSISEPQPQIVLANSKVDGEVHFEETAVLDIANFGLNVESFSAADGVNVTLKLTEEAQAELDENEYNDFLSYETVSADEVYEYLDEYGISGEELFLLSKVFPKGAVQYFNHIILSNMDFDFSIPVPKCSQANSEPFMFYWYDEIPETISTNSRITGLRVAMPDDVGFSTQQYREALNKMPLFEKIEDADEWCYSNFEDAGRELDELIEYKESEDFNQEVYNERFYALANTKVFFLYVNIEEIDMSQNLSYLCLFTTFEDIISESSEE